ncbi:hypothetical protein M2275_006006, partial [Rhodococcus opacus]|nr:hypothetical protein [Rhodococcus opacus]
ATAPTTTNTLPGTTAAPPGLLDDLRPWDVYKNEADRLFRKIGAQLAPTDAPPMAVG